MSHTTATIIKQCKESGLRRTKALELLIETLLDSPRPMTLGELSEHKNLNTQCDRATVFRLLQRLTDKGVIRRLGLHERAAYFTILLEGRHQDFLICSECGQIEPIKAACPVHKLEREIAATTGFTGLYHELEFFGVCPKCSK
jgi:Fe2+ or Zn2+ uptake regulation protein